jgi:hypothetical protein
MRAVAVVTLFLAIVVLSGGLRPPLARADDKGTVVKVGSLSGTTPADWKKEKPANLLRSFQFKLAGEKGLPDAELAVFPESHPSAEKNFPKWKGQFVPPEDKTVDDLSKTGKWDVKGATVTYLDVAGGTWKYKERPQDPKSKEMFLDNYRVIWVIVAEKEEATHIRLSGPKATVDKHHGEFEKWIKSLK